MATSGTRSASGPPCRTSPLRRCPVRLRSSARPASWLPSGVCERGFSSAERRSGRTAETAALASVSPGHRHGLEKSDQGNDHLRLKGVGLKIRGGRRSHPVLVALSIVCIAAGFLIAAQIGWFLRSSSVHGAALIHRERRAIAAAEANRTACRDSAGGLGGASPGHGTPAPRTTANSGAAPRVLLEAPARGLVAPVLEGTGDVTLNDAVGHVPASVWPGHTGTTVLSAHNVTWFSRIDRLQAGDEIRYVTPCRTYTYRVTSHRVVPAGSPVYNTATPSIVLDTRYPLNALHLTRTRYLVYGTLTTISPTSVSRTRRPGSPPFTVPVPAALAAQGVATGQNS